MEAVPKISIVTPNYNGAEYLEQTILSVLDQNYPNLEYVIIDDGSTDNSPEIIRKYEDRLAYWTTRPNKGQYPTINEGFERTSGEIMAWLNSDDMYLPGALSIVAEIFAHHPEVDWLSTIYRVVWNEANQATAVAPLSGFNRQMFYEGVFTLWGTRPNSRGCIQQESTFWRRSLWERAGGRLDVSYEIAADFELWARFYEHAELQGVSGLLGGFRFREGQKSSAVETYSRECERALRSCRQPVPKAKRAGVLSRLGKGPTYPARTWYFSGRGGSWTLREEHIS